MDPRIRRTPGSLLALLIAIVGILAATQGCGVTGDTLPTARPGTAQTTRATVLTTTATVTPRRPTPTVTTAVAAGGRPTPTPTPRGQPTEPAANDGLPQIEFGRLPPQAQETIRLIERGGPFPYERDGVTFGNRERLLPIRAAGYYREYTVTTPGSSDRGARRIVAGRDGELYYTDDHYESFRRVRR